MLSIRSEVLCFICIVFFFNDTAPTEIYPYRHTLSLHSALPISGRPWPAADLPEPVGLPLPRRTASPARQEHCATRRAATAKRTNNPPHSNGRCHRRRARSEEHTSELQSLMRISYAVFCLKKKNKMLSEHNNQ